MANQPFVVFGEEEHNDIYTVKDVYNNAIEIPRYYSLTIDECIAIDEASVKLYQNKDNFPPQSKVIAYEVAAFLRCRFESPEIDINYLNRYLKKFSLIKAIYEFIQNESSGWDFEHILGEFRGKLANKLATEYIKIHPDTIIVTSPELRLLDIWYIYDLLDNVPDNYLVLTVNGIEKKQTIISKQSPPKKEEQSGNISQKYSGNSDGVTPVVNYSPKTTSQNVS